MFSVEFFGASNCCTYNSVGIHCSVSVTFADAKVLYRQICKSLKLLYLQQFRQNQDQKEDQDQNQEQGEHQKEDHNQEEKEDETKEDQHQNKEQHQDKNEEQDKLQTVVRTTLWGVGVQFGNPS